MDTDIMRVITATQVTPGGGCTVGMVVRAIPHSCLAAVATPVARLDWPAPTWSVVPGREYVVLREYVVPRGYVVLRDSFTRCRRCSRVLCRC